MSTLRLFAALPVPAHMRPGLVALQKGLEGASWRPPENFHVTLRFFGHVDHSMAREIDHELGLIAAAQIELDVTGVGWFGAREPHAVWAGITGSTEADSEALTRLASACERVARRLRLPPETRAFRPHITLAYLHRTPLDAVGQWARRMGDFHAGPFWADRFHLYSSHETRGPTCYVAEAEYPLG